MSEYIGPKTRPDDLTLLIEGKRFGGWQGLRITRGIERFPSSFEISATEYDPTSATKVIIKPGAACTLQLGNDTVLTGYVERYKSRIAPGLHEITLAGRSKACDLLCSVDRQGNQFRSASTLSIARDLGAPYSISASAPDGEGPILPFLNFFITQTPYDIIAQAARWAQLLVYDDANGDLVLAQAGKHKMASGFAEGVNIEASDVDFNITERFSEYRCFIQSTDWILDPTINAGEDPNRIAVVKDTDAGIRHRVLSFVAEAGQNYRQFALQQAQWEMNRRRGRSQAVRLVTDTWRDKAGTLWQPNYLASLSIPSAKIMPTEWIIAEVVFLRGPEGTHAELILMPPESFQPQPSNLYQFNPAVMAALTNPDVAGSRNVIDGLQRRDR